LGVADVGIASARDYLSPRSPSLESIFPGVKSLVVLAYRELANCESENMQIAMGGRLDAMEFARSCSYKVGCFVEREFRAKAVTIPLSYPLHMSYETKGTIADVSLRHAAVAAGLGVFGRHNLIIHPQMGSRVLFTAVLTDLELPPEQPVEESLCNECMTCVDSCPAGALDEAGKTHDMKCLRNSQPYGIGASIGFWSKFAAASPEDRQAMLKDPHYWRLYQAGFIGFQYFCFNCTASCPAGN
jgi:epoxyqueuosine reductase